eukprot:11065731-Alexandrium_andersonii.AAC.1
MAARGGIFRVGAGNTRRQPPAGCIVGRSQRFPPPHRCRTAGCITQHSDAHICSRLAADHSAWMPLRCRPS